MVTPTGAAILATLAQFQTPAISIERVGYGFGQNNFPGPIVCASASDGQDTHFNWVRKQIPIGLLLLKAT